MLELGLKVLISYLIGSLTGALIVGKLAGGIDIRTQGSGNAGGTNALRTQGMSLYEAVMDGAETRFLPILLTSMTAIGGMTPLVLERSPLISPLAIVLIGGLISSTLLSRLVTPVLYYLIPPKVD